MRGQLLRPAPVLYGELGHGPDMGAVQRGLIDNEERLPYRFSHHNLCRSEAMTVTIDLPPELEERLTAQAQSQGLALREYLRNVLLEMPLERKAASLSHAERAAAWREGAKGLPHATPLSDAAISRESLYAERG
jgi:hypothetical protein